MKDEQQNNSTISLIICSFARFQFFLLTDLTSLVQCRRAFRLALNPQKEHGPLWIWLWKFSDYKLCVRANVHHAYLDLRLEYWSLDVTPYGVRCWELWSNLWLKVRMRIRVLHSHAGNPQSMRWNVSQEFGSFFPVSGQRLTPSSFLQRGSGQLVGQRVPALHLLALVLQTVYPVLQSVSLWVTP